MSPSEQPAASIPEQRAHEAIEPVMLVPPLGGAVGKLINGLDRLFAFLAAVALLAIVVVVLLQVVSRTMLPTSPVWTEELSRYLFIYLVAISSGLVLRRNRNVGLELYQHRLGARGRAAYQLLVCVALGVFAAIVLPSAWKYAQIGQFQTSPALYVPMIYIFFSTVVLFALVLLYSALGGIEALIVLLRRRNA
ncbi:TRAP transporter small permease [Phytohalomonas tamaricis]|uniref:TRAP transporter small permease n=1 Tax=Phytohalomonas tamaricis TaxID=2081032 RepID=UPI0021D44E97|nr:TRAP transporter small permease [Phytohalomonas tamaricis]